MKTAIIMLGDILGGEAAEKCNRYVSYLDENIALIEKSLDGKLSER